MDQAGGTQYEGWASRRSHQEDTPAEGEQEIQDEPLGFWGNIISGWW